MPRACTAPTHTLAPLMKMSDAELRSEIHNAAAQHPLKGLHLCHELLHFAQYWPPRPGLQRLVGRCLTDISWIIQNQPEL